MIKLKNNIEDLLDSLSKSKFRGSFHLNKKMKDYVKEKGFDKEPFPLKAWQNEFSELSAQREAEYQEYKLIQKELTLLYQIKGDVDRVLRKTYPELMHSHQVKEQETAL